jgi:3-oxoadipate enol-lactonase
MRQRIDRINLSAADTGLGRPLVFLHGFPFNRSAWHMQTEAFRQSHRVIAPDLRGFGNSATLPGPTTMADYAGDVYTLLQEFTTGPVVLVGHSMGGYVALAFASDFPEMLRGLVLVSTRAGSDSVEAAAGRRATAGKVRDQGVDEIIETMSTKMLAPGNQHTGLADGVRGLMASTKPEVMIAALLGMAARPDATPELPQIAVPTLIITGADDTVVLPEESEKLAHGIPGSQLRVIPHAGHLVFLEQPEEFNRVLKDWLIREDVGALQIPGVSRH